MSQNLSEETTAALEAKIKGDYSYPAKSRIARARADGASDAAIRRFIVAFLEKQPHWKNDGEPKDWPKIISDPDDHIPTLESLRLRAPGRIRDISQWILDTSTQPQPEFALASAIATIGALVGRKVSACTGLLTNQYIIELGDTGSGKDRPIKCASQFLRLAGETRSIMGRWGSDAGIELALQQHQNRIMLIDEIAHVLGASRGKSSQSYEQRVESLLLAMFSAATDSYETKALADKERPIESIIQPCLSLFGATTPAALWAALSMADASSGFLSRLSVFMRDPSRPLTPPNCLAKKTPPSAFLVEWAKQWAAFVPPGNVAGLTLNPSLIEVTPDAKSKRIIEEWGKSSFFAMAAEQPGMKKELLNRSFEKSLKFATVAAVGRTDAEDALQGITMIASDIEWAIDLEKRLTADMIRASSRKLSANQIDADSKFCEELIRDAGPRGIKRTELGDKCRRFGARRRQEIIGELLELEKITVTQENTGKRPTQIFIHADYQRPALSLAA